MIGYLPSSFTCDFYRKQVEMYAGKIDIQGGAVVSGSFQMYDQTYLIDALEQLGPTFVGVTQFPSDTCDDEILKLHSTGMRAIRFNINRGVAMNLQEIKSMSLRVYNLVKWHSEFYIDCKLLEDPGTDLLFFLHRAYVRKVNMQFSLIVPL